MSKSTTPIAPLSGELSPGDDSSAQNTRRSPSVSLGKPNMLISICAIVLGGSLGCLLRWYLAIRLNALFPQLPPGTLAANIIGGYFIGVAMAIFLAFPALSPQWRLLTVTGFLGGLTTFSSFSAEVVTAILEDRGLWAAATVGVHVIGSVVMTLCGVGTVRLVRSFF